MRPLIITFLFFLFTSINIDATEIRLLPPHRVILQGTNLIIEARTGSTLLEGEILEYLNFGIVITFTYFVELWQENRLLDERVAYSTLSKRIYYDLWSEQYFVESTAPVIRQTATRRLEQVKQELQLISGVALNIEKALNPNSTYRFRSRITMKITQLNSVFHVLFNLLSVFKFRTTWLWGQPTTMANWEIQ